MSTTLEAPEIPQDVTESESSSKGSDKERLTPPDGGFTGYPEGLDLSKHSMPKKSDFKDDIVYWEFQNSLYQQKIDANNERINLAKTCGDTKEANRLKKMLGDLQGFLGSEAISDDMKKNLIGADGLEGLQKLLGG